MFFKSKMYPKKKINSDYKEKLLSFSSNIGLFLNTGEWKGGGGKRREGREGKREEEKKGRRATVSLVSI